VAEAQASASRSSGSAAQLPHFTSRCTRGKMGRLPHYPGLKGREDRALCRGCAKGSSIVSSDDFTLPKSDKLAAECRQLTGGHNASRRAWACLLEACAAEGLGQQVRRPDSEGPARLFGSSPEGRHPSGSDADIVLLDPELSYQIRQDECMRTATTASGTVEVRRLSRHDDPPGQVWGRQEMVAQTGRQFIAAAPDGAVILVRSAGAGGP